MNGVLVMVQENVMDVTYSCVRHVREQNVTFLKNVQEDLLPIMNVLV
jgi:hypothetical protein